MFWQLQIDWMFNMLSTEKLSSQRAVSTVKFEHLSLSLELNSAGCVKIAEHFVIYLAHAFQKGMSIKENNFGPDSILCLCTYQ